MKENQKILFVNIINDEGDTGRFSGCDEYGEYIGIDYDIDLDYFSEKEIAIFEGLGENNGLTNVEKKYGAGRNG
jgi:hypothetical protein